MFYSWLTSTDVRCYPQNTLKKHRPHTSLLLWCITCDLTQILAPSSIAAEMRTKELITDARTHACYIFYSKLQTTEAWIFTQKNILSKCTDTVCPHTMRDYCCLITMKGTNYKTNVSVSVRSLICDCISHLCLCLCDWHSTGSLIQVPMSEKGKITRGRLGSLSLKKEGERQCFLFSKHLIICTRGSGGKLHITKVWQDCNQEDQLIMVNLIITN